MASARRTPDGPDGSRTEPREDRAAALLEGMLDPVVTIDGFGTIEHASLSVATVFGYRPDELIGRNIKILMPEPHRSRHDEYLALYRETGETAILGRTREFEVLHRDGTLLTCELSVSRVDVPGEDRPLFIGSFRDVTARRRAECLLAESERRFRAIFDQEFQYVGLLGPDGTMLEANEAALSGTGTRREDVVGKPFWEARWWANCADARERIRDAVQRAAGGEFVRFEVELLGRGREMRSVDFSLKPVLNESGEVELLIPEGRDITELKQAQRRETAMLRALATIGESAALLAHEIKNPITAINVALRAVADQLGEDHRVVLDELVGRMQRLERTMRRTLSFARPVELSREPFAAGDLFERVEEGVRAMVEGSQTRVEAEVAPDCPPVDADPHLLEDVLANLVRNSIEAIDGEGLVRISARGEKGERVMISVEDDGPGFGEGHAMDAFKPFVTTKATGTGLGLAICKKVVEEHGGEIKAGCSDLGGARVSIRLPAATELAATENGMKP